MEYFERFLTFEAPNQKSLLFQKILFAGIPAGNYVVDVCLNSRNPNEFSEGPKFSFPR
jgi:hypothetical protein